MVSGFKNLNLDVLEKNGLGDIVKEIRNVRKRVYMGREVYFKYFESCL